MCGGNHDRKAPTVWLQQHAESLTTSAGWASLGLGLPLVVAPQRAAALIGLRESPTMIRAFGLLDLVLGCDLLSGRPIRPQTPILLVAMLLLTGVDSLVAQHQRAAQKYPPSRRPC